jgi:hypothetical protein
MVEQEYHEMVLETVHQSGAEEWYCPTCGRRFLMNWPPAFNKVVLELGDETAIHSGGKGSVNVHYSQEDSEEETLLSPEEQVTLYPWIEWMEQVNFEALWDRTPVSFDHNRQSEISLFGSLFRASPWVETGEHDGEAGSLSCLGPLRGTCFRSSDQPGNRFMIYRVAGKVERR